MDIVIIAMALMFLVVMLSIITAVCLLTSKQNEIIDILDEICDTIGIGDESVEESDEQ